jgi:hypothetical protein
MRKIFLILPRVFSVTFEVYSQAQADNALYKTSTVAITKNRYVGRCYDTTTNYRCKANAGKVQELANEIFPLLTDLKHSLNVYISLTE